MSSMMSCAEIQKEGSTGTVQTEVKKLPGSIGVYFFSFSRE